MFLLLTLNRSMFTGTYDYSQNMIRNILYKMQDGAKKKF